MRVRVPQWGLAQALAQPWALPSAVQREHSWAPESEMQSASALVRSLVLVSGLQVAELSLAVTAGLGAVAMAAELAAQGVGLLDLRGEFFSIESSESRLRCISAVISISAIGNVSWCDTVMPAV